MKTALYSVLIFVAVLFFTITTGIIGITYPKIISREPLVRPVEVQVSDQDTLTTPSGQVIGLQHASDAGGSWEKILSQSSNLVDLEPQADGIILVYANQKGWVCGTPWASGLRIPLIPETVYKDRRELIAIGTLEEESGRKSGE